MCGIAGAIDLKGRREFPAARLLAMTGAIAHRGPDDEQIHIEPGVALGARRLSIVDLAGRPAADRQRGRLDLGRLQRRALRVSRAPPGAPGPRPPPRHPLRHRGSGSTSTRTCARGCSPRPAASSPSRSGTATTRTLILGRDRVGICPLYYAEADGWLLWGSEIKALLASGMVEARPDRKGIDHLLHFFCAGTTRTFFEGIKSIPPGHYLQGPGRPGRAEASTGTSTSPTPAQERRLDDPDPAGRRAGGPAAPGGRAAAAGRRAGRQLHQRRARLDGRAGALQLAQRGEPVPSFTIGLDRAGPDERSHATEAAAVLGSPLTTVTMNRADIVDGLSRADPRRRGAGARLGLRLPDAAGRRVHQQGYKVVLTGEGADEALAGYVWFKTQKIRDGVYRTVGSATPSRGSSAASSLGIDRRRPAAW